MPNRLLALATLLTLASCGGSRPYDDRMVFRYNESKGIPSLDPAFARSQASIWPVNQLFNGLVQLTDSLTVAPSIAARWSVSADGRRYTFHLRSDVYFHDSPAFPNGQGRRVVAQDFIYSIGRIINPAVASPGAWVFSMLDTSREGTTHGCWAPNDSTLHIYLAKPYPPFLGILSMPYAFVVPREAVEKFGKDFRANPVGTGPFRFKLWKEGEKLVMRRNPNYFERDERGQRLPYLEAINITFIADKQSEFLEFLKGNLDFISGVDAASRDELLTRSGQLSPQYRGRIQMLTGPYLNTEYMGFQLDPNLPLSQSPLADVRVRRAIGYGFDRARMMTFLRNNLGYPAHSGFVPQGMPGMGSRISGFSYNPERSKALLEEAGFPGGRGLPVIPLATTGAYLDIFEFIQHQLSLVGIPIAIEVLPGAAYRDMLANARLAMFRGSWIADYADPENYFALFYSPNFTPGGPNYTRFSHEAFDRMYRQALQTTDEHQRQSLYRAMDSLVIAYAPVIPLYYDKVVRFVQLDVHGMSPNPMNLLCLKRVRKEPGVEEQGRAGHRGAAGRPR